MRPIHSLSSAVLVSVAAAVASGTQAHVLSPFTCPALSDISATCPLPQSQPQPRPQEVNHKPSSIYHRTPGTPVGYYGPSDPTEPPSPPPQPQQAAAPEKDKNPWTKGPLCRRAGHDEFCAFTHTTFHSGRGISLITTPTRMLLLGSQPPLNETLSPPATPDTPPPYTDVTIPGKGIGLVATEPIRAGRRVMAATPAVMVDDKAFRGLRRDDLAMLLGQAIISLPAQHSARFLNLSASGDDDVRTQFDIVHKIFTTNAFRTPVQGVELGENEKIEGWEKEMDYQSTFVEVSRLNHACAPNLGYYFDSATLSHRVYAVKDILPGEELTISYVDVLQPSTTRQSLLAKTWSFTCTCPRCTAEAHLLDESDARARQIQQLRRELDDHSVSATPEKAELLITLYELEGLHVRIYEAYYRAAIEWNGVGDSGRAMRYARLCLDKGLLLRGPNRPFVDSMRELVADPTHHWSWRFRLKSAQEAKPTAV